MKILVRTTYLFVTLVCLAGASLPLAAQDYAEVVRADQATRNPNITEARRLLGNVHLRYRGADMFCDSAYIYDNEDFEAFGPLRVVQGDSVQLRGGYLFAERDQQLVTLEENIFFSDKDLSLQTEALTYNMETGIARYLTGATITSQENNNRLSSRAGYYDAESEFFHFQKDVVLRNPKYTVYSDTLKYSGASETAFFHGPTRIVADDAFILCTHGWYNTRTDQCQFSEGATIRNGSTVLQGDSVFYNAATGYGELFCDISIRDTTGNYIVSGDYGWLDEASGKSLVTERALMTQIFDGDSLFLRADTLLNLPDSAGNNRIRAYHDVRIFKTDLQGVCDSLIFEEHLERLTLLKDPVMWSEKSQISGDTLILTLQDNALHRLEVLRNAMIVSEVDSIAYNQIAGRDLYGYFEENQLVRMDVNGNGRVVYYPESADPNAPPVGLNRSDCSNLRIFFEDNQIRRIALLQQVGGAFHPLSQAPETDRSLPGFQWLQYRRPLSFDHLFDF